MRCERGAWLAPLRTEGASGAAGTAFCSWLGAARAGRTAGPRQTGLSWHWTRGSHCAFVCHAAPSQSRFSLHVTATRKHGGTYRGSPQGWFARGKVAIPRDVNSCSFYSRSAWRFTGQRACSWGFSRGVSWPSGSVTVGNDNMLIFLDLVSLQNVLSS